MLLGRDAVIIAGLALIDVHATNHRRDCDTCPSRHGPPKALLIHENQAMTDAVHSPSTMNRLLLVVALALLAACSSSTPRSAVTFTGSGPDKSSLQHLSGDYRVVWTFASRPPTCEPILTLESPTNGAVMEILVNGQPGLTGTTNLYGLKDDQYFVEGELNDCGPWTVALTPA